jgi:hypothetical protein
MELHMVKSLYTPDFIAYGIIKGTLYIYISIILIACKYEAVETSNTDQLIIIEAQENQTESNQEVANLTVLPALPQCDGTCTCDEVLVKSNDTGTVKSAESLTDNLSYCSFAILLGQDCRYGRDSINLLNKVGAGNAGFDFSKISNTGNVLPQESTQWQCVLDNHTGLMWEVKKDTSIDDIGNKTQLFTWESDDYPDYSAENTGECNVFTTCDTQTYINMVNNNKKCGYNNWRLPNKNQLQGLVDYGSYQPSIDINFFPETGNGFYWTSTIDIDDIGSIWQIGFSSGRVAGSHSGDARYVRLVREHKVSQQVSPIVSSNEQDIIKRNQVAPFQRCNIQAQISSPISRFKQDLQGNILDTHSGLIWKRCMEGLTGEACDEGEQLKTSWLQALLYAEKISNNETTPLATNWRLPNIKELQSIVETQCEEPALNPFVFPNIPFENVWSSTPHSFYTDSSYYLQYQNSIIFYGSREQQLSLHLVRNCQ